MGLFDKLLGKSKKAKEALPLTDDPPKKAQKGTDTSGSGVGRPIPRNADDARKERERRYRERNDSQTAMEDDGIIAPTTIFVNDDGSDPDAGGKGDEFGVDVPKQDAPAAPDPTPTPDPTPSPAHDSGADGGANSGSSSDSGYSSTGSDYSSGSDSGGYSGGSDSGGSSGGSDF